MTLTVLQQRYETRRNAYLAKVGQAQATKETVDRLSGRVAQLKADAVTYAQVVEVFKTYSEAEHEALRGRIESLVTFGLSTVFGDGLSFKITPGTERGQATMRFSIVDESVGETDIIDARGGGLAAIVGFLLRLVVLVLSPAETTRRFLMLDETFGMLSAEYQEPMSRLLRQLCDDLGLQVVLVTHQPAIAAHADLVYEFAHDGTKTVVRTLEPGDI